MTLTPEEHDAVARWVRVVGGQSYTTQLDLAVLPVLQRVLDEAQVGDDPYAGKRTVVAREDVIGGHDDRGITRPSERKRT